MIMNDERTKQPTNARWVIEAKEIQNNMFSKPKAKNKNVIMHDTSKSKNFACMVYVGQGLMYRVKG
jgi:hypothetical protein